MTRAGQRLELSQPAMSAALARLRRRFDDELLVRAGRDYELTPFARDLLPEVQHAVRLMGSGAPARGRVRPVDAQRTFRLTMSDYAIAVVHEPLVRMVEAEAPGVRLSIGHLGPESRSSDRVLLDNDALIAPLGFGFPGISRPLWRDRMVVMADRAQPAPRRRPPHHGRPRRAPARRRLLRPRRPHPRRPGLRRARHRAPRRPPGLRLPARCPSSSRAPTWSPSSPRCWPACTCAPAAPSCSSSRRSARCCSPRATGSPRTGCPTPRTGGCSPGSTRCAISSQQGTKQWWRRESRRHHQLLTYRRLSGGASP